MRVLMAVAIFAVIAAASATEEKDWTLWFKDEAKLKVAMACLMDKGPCGEDLQALKVTIPTLVKDDCASCDEALKGTYNVVKKILNDNYPEYFKALLKKYPIPVKQ